MKSADRDQSYRLVLSLREPLTSGEKQAPAKDQPKKTSQAKSKDQADATEQPKYRQKRVGQEKETTREAKSAREPSRPARRDVKKNDQA